MPKPQSRMFLEHMIYYGKILYLKDLWLPEVDDSEKIGYTSEEIQWAKENEEQVWRYFVERELLFSNDTELQSRFLFPAPFSKFYLELDNETPAMLGHYIGCQMLRQYKDRTGADLQKILNAPAEEIFKQSNYKPRK
ncbi:hypothetical protein [Antarcticibacterium sp. 1MA-6-2]|uniref:gliding motility lipoprotein GldB n=1 Tax=Antarcticibacterium sp. 1MA-6-2 TaxID=2908210 RepID=UPI0028831405|nr:hypothetical protein [Antarcticibacterium sp. 1MA-6-2]